VQLYSEAACDWRSYTSTNDLMTYMCDFSESMKRDATIVGITETHCVIVFDDGWHSYRILPEHLIRLSRRAKRKKNGRR